MCRCDHESADALQTDAVGSTFGEELAKGVVEPVGGPVARWTSRVADPWPPRASAFAVAAG
jgi:hypothetical protein